MAFADLDERWTKPSSSWREPKSLSRDVATGSLTRRRKPLGTILPASRETSPSCLTLIGSTKPSMRKGSEWHRQGSISMLDRRCDNEARVRGRTRPFGCSRGRGVEGNVKGVAHLQAM